MSREGEQKDFVRSFRPPSILGLGDRYSKEEVNNDMTEFGMEKNKTNSSIRITRMVIRWNAMINNYCNLLFVVCYTS